MLAVNQVDDGAIPDVDVTDTYGTEIYTLYRAGILVGNDAYGTFTPSTYITRGAVATIIARMVDESVVRISP